jgi:TetR/AcrR family transcriptional repressor of bet genes
MQILLFILPPSVQGNELNATTGLPMSASNKKQLVDAAPRKASREMRRQQFIEATIATLARNGYARTTLTDVAASAGLSHGLIIFHFENKEKLLSETLVYLAREYRDNWTQALAEAPKQPAAQLEALIRADFVESICNPGRLGAWSALWGEIQSRPIYREYGVNFDVEYAATVQRLCAELIAEGGYPFDVDAVSRVVRVSLEGLWLELMNTSEPYPVDQALGAMFQLAMAFFPKHFGKDGAL